MSFGAFPSHADRDLPEGVRYEPSVRRHVDAEGYEVRWQMNELDLSYSVQRVGKEPIVQVKPPPVPTVDFGAALAALNQGRRVARAGWNGKGMYLFYVAGWTYTNGKNDNMPCLPFIAMKTADDKVVPWLASQTDTLSNDWIIL